MLGEVPTLSTELARPVDGGDSLHTMATLLAFLYRMLFGPAPLMNIINS